MEKKLHIGKMLTISEPASRVGEMNMNKQSSESRLSHSKHKHNPEVQGNISEDHEKHWASAADGLLKNEKKLFIRWKTYIA